MTRKIGSLALVMLMALMAAGCSTNDNSGQRNSDTSKPQPQVRVGSLPTGTPTLPEMADNLAPTPEATASPTAAWLYYDPTPDEDAIANQIQNLMDGIDHTLNSQNFNFSK